MTLKDAVLMKDLERLNDLLTIARNILATTKRAQDLAGDSGFDQQVLKLIDICVRVTARAYEGEEPGRRTENQLGLLNTSCKCFQNGDKAHIANIVFKKSRKS